MTELLKNLDYLEKAYKNGELNPKFTVEVDNKEKEKSN